jgi:hypothetical protein
MGIMTTSTTRRRFAASMAVGVVLSSMVATSTNAFGSAGNVAGSIAGNFLAESDSTSTSLAYGYDLENDPENCINFLPRPDCGREPQQAGDRGGALQFALFGIVLAALGTIGTVIVRNVVRRDKALAAQHGDD